MTYKYKRILIFNVNWLGDVLFSTATIRNIRRNFPESFIACAVPSRCYQVLKDNPNLDEIIIFDQLEEDAMFKILDLMIEPMALNLQKRSIKFSITKSAKKWIVKKCNSREYGARELRRVLNKEVADPISKILFKDEKTKRVHVTTAGEGLEISGS